jgi:hypothetical protein
MDYQTLNTELTTDPLTRGYAGMTDQEAADDLNTVYRTRPRGSMNGDEIFAATDNTEFAGLTEHKRQLWVSFTSKDIINAYEQTNIDFVDYIFGGGSTTKATLAGLRDEDISRAAELDLGYSGEITASHVNHARTL